MATTGLRCKAYYVTDVKRIMLPIFNRIAPNWRFEAIIKAKIQPPQLHLGLDREVVMASPVRPDPKCDHLQRRAMLNPHPERIRDALFLIHPFFDPRGLIQVKYELLHRVLVEGQPVGATAAAFGFSRVTVQQLRKRFEAEGLAGLMPRRKGPCRASKLTEEVLAYIWQILKDEPDLEWSISPEGSSNSLVSPSTCAVSNERGSRAKKRLVGSSPTVRSSGR